MQHRKFGGSGSKLAKLTRADAEAIAVEVLHFLAAEKSRLDRFLELSGVTVGELRKAAAEPFFLAGLLDHLSSDEDLLLSFAAHAGRKAETIAEACRTLSVWQSSLDREGRGIESKAHR